MHCFLESCKPSTKPLFIHFFDKYSFPGICTKKWQQTSQAASKGWLKNVKKLAKTTFHQNSNNDATTKSGLNGTTNPTNNSYIMIITDHDNTLLTDTNNTTATTKHDNNNNIIDTPIRNEGSLSVPKRW